ncbi:hypothetical protein CGZ69_22465 [Streptomyces peucetius subsp. caesius ATCC 27952]|nr:hypothetical protein CGZ69_22465 [Streptomyces peucetius subsp. caesius ATCC 27952]
MVAATVIGGGGLVVAAPAAHAAEASDVVAKLPISSFSDMVVDSVNDMPRARRDVTDTVSYEGDDLHTGSSASAKVYVTR